MNAAFHVKFWGVRGSVPAPGASTVRYGGNTTCVEVRNHSQMLILDAGTGIRLLGKDLKTARRDRPGQLTLLLTHTHWDHIQGLPFFITSLEPEQHLRILGCEGAREGLATLLARQMESPFFPVPLGGSAAPIQIQELSDSEFQLGDLNVRSLRANHPGTCVGYRLDSPGGSLAFFPDNEPYNGKLRMANLPPDDPQAKRATQNHRAMVDFLKGVDVLIMDSQYDATEYSSHVGWGHGCVDDVVDLAIEAQVCKLVLFHHDPDHDDRKVSAMAAAAAQRARNSGAALHVEAAREGETFSIGG
jgi:phosphoribosyl 1,2-cyclic phosphodiesterase